MELITVNINNLDAIKQKVKSFQHPFVATIGNFDGMHLYHQKVLAQTKQWSNQYQLPMMVVSFSQNVYDYLHQQDNRITTTIQKAHFIEHQYNPELFIEIITDKQLINTSKKEFIQILKDQFQIIKIVEGADFRFGAQGQGTIADLQTAFGIKNIWVEPRTNEISSTKIRKLLKAGRKAEANKLLGIKVK